jgi:hypothetical protein
MQETLRQQKIESDQAFLLVENKFSENQKEALARVDEMERKWMANYEAIQAQNKQYYEDSSKALDARVGGEQAAVAGSLQAKGINAGVIAT